MSEVRGLRAGWIIPIAGPPLRHGIVTIAQGKVVGLGTQTSNVPITDYGNAVILPALINAHTHLEFSHLSQPLESTDGTFAGWIEAVVQQRRDALLAACHESPLEHAYARGSRETLQGGCAYVGNIATLAEKADHHACDPRWPLSGIEFHEVLGLRPSQGEEKCQALLSWLERGQPEGWTPGISPHAPYTLHQQTFQRLIDIATSHDLTVAMHLAESHDEMELLRTHQGPFRDLFDAWQVWDDTAFTPGTSPRDYLQQLTKTSRALVVHGNYLNHDDLEFLAARRHQLALVHCPRTHAHFQHDCNPLLAGRKQGVRIVVGTDSRASNPDLSLFEELRFLVHRYPSIDPGEFLAMATSEPAAALGLSRCGQIAPGREATFAIVQACDDAHDPYAFLQHNPASVCEVIVQGVSRWKSPGDGST